jgi:RNAse (barnase) inhibitor barstar
VSAPEERLVVLDASLDSLGAVRDRLVAGLGLPAWTAANLDALWDALTVEARGPLRIVWRDHAQARGRLGADYAPLVALLRDLVKARPDVRLSLE